MTSEYKKIAKRCDLKWAEIIKIRASHKSEISGRCFATGHGIAAHHIYGKANATLRWLTFENGICLDSIHEHFYGCHFGSMAQKEITRRKICQVRGEDIFERMSILKHNKTQKHDIRLVEMFLDNELKKMEGGKTGRGES